MLLLLGVCHLPPLTLHPGWAYSTWRFSQFLNFESSLPNTHVIIWRAFIDARTTLRFLYQCADDGSRMPYNKKRANINVNWFSILPRCDPIMHCAYLYGGLLSLEAYLRQDAGKQFVHIMVDCYRYLDEFDFVRTGKTFPVCGESERIW